MRRQLLDALRDGPRTSGELVESVGASRHVALQHLAVLRGVDLVIVEKQGRTRLNYLNAVPLEAAIGRWLSPYQQDWAAALVGLRATVEASHRNPRRGRAEDKDTRSA